MSKPLIPVKDLAKYLNQALPQMVGQDMKVPDVNGVQPGEEGYIETIITKEFSVLDSDNLADFGKAYDDLDEQSRMNFKKELVTLITKQVFVLKQYTPWGPNIMRTYEGERGILQKIKMPIQYNALESTSSFEDPQVTTSNFVDFEVNAKYFYKPVTKKMRFTISDQIMAGLFLNMNNASKFISLIWNSVDISKSIHYDAISMGVINTATAMVLYGGQDTQKYNLLGMYNSAYGTTLTVAEALRTKEFHRFSKSVITRVRDLMTAPSGLYNLEGIPTQTTDADSYVWMLSDFTRTADEYLLSDTYHNDLVKLKGGKPVNRWQTIGDGTFEQVSSISMKFTPIGGITPITVTQSGIVGIIAHEDSVAITNVVEDTTSKYEPEDRYTAYYPRLYSEQIIDLSEDYVVFYMEEETVPETLKAMAESVKGVINVSELTMTQLKAKAKELGVENYSTYDSTNRAELEVLVEAKL